MVVMAAISYARNEKTKMAAITTRRRFLQEAPQPSNPRLGKDSLAFPVVGEMHCVTNR